MVSALSTRGHELIGKRSDVDVTRAAAELLEWTCAVRPEGLPDVVSALGGLAEPALAPELAPLAAHEDMQVRLVVAQVLAELRDDSPATVSALVRLSLDCDDEVRSWATFALAGDRLAAAPGVEDALFARLTDPCEDVRVEAARGLARRPSLH